MSRVPVLLCLVLIPGVMLAMTAAAQQQSNAPLASPTEAPPAASPPTQASPPTTPAPPPLSSARPEAAPAAPATSSPNPPTAAATPEVTPPTSVAPAAPAQPGSPPATTQAAPASPAAPPPPAPPPPAPTSAAPTLPPPPPVVPAEQVAPVELTGLLGEIVVAPGEARLLIVDVLADSQGHLRAVVVDVGGFMGVGNRKVAVAWAALHFTASDKGPVISILIPADRIRSWAEYIPGRPVAILGATSSTR